MLSGARIATRVDGRDNGYGGARARMELSASSAGLSSQSSCPGDSEERRAKINTWKKK